MTRKTLPSELFPTNLVAKVKVPTVAEMRWHLHLARRARDILKLPIFTVVDCTDGEVAEVKGELEQTSNMLEDLKTLIDACLHVVYEAEDAIAGA
jgi:hypothetical protein